jgi:hypothetical protein
MTSPNHWFQATRGCALLFFLAHWPRVPEPKRSMKALFAFSFPLVLVLMGGCTTGVQSPIVHRDYVTDLDFTTTTDFDAVGLAGNQHLRTFGTNDVQGFSDEYIFGEYRSSMDLTGGHNLHVFPDGCFVIEEFCDVGAPATIAMVIHWTFLIWWIGRPHRHFLG